MEKVEGKGTYQTEMDVVFGETEMQPDGCHLVMDDGEMNGNVDGCHLGHDHSEVKVKGRRLPSLGWRE